LRIWIQSNTGAGFDPRWAVYDEVERAHLAAAAAPGTEIRFAGVEKMERKVEHSPYSRYVNSRQLIDAGRQAEADGYDAFVVAGMGVAGRAQLEEILAIPVVFAEAVTWHFASWLHGSFGIIGHDKIVYRRRVEQVRRSGLLGALVPGDFADLSVDDVLEGFGSAGKVLDEVGSSAIRAVHDGARCLIPSFNVLNTLLVQEGVTQLHGVPVLDTSAITLKAAEMVVAGRQIAGFAPSGWSVEG
jgi:Asp/Glu/hydantoin racemase